MYPYRDKIERTAPLVSDAVWKGKQDIKENNK